MKPKFLPNADLSMRGKIGRSMIGAQNALMIDGTIENMLAHIPPMTGGRHGIWLADQVIWNNGALR
jgi:hypothetical protein